MMPRHHDAPSGQQTAQRPLRRTRGTMVRLHKPCFRKAAQGIGTRQRAPFPSSLSRSSLHGKEKRKDKKEKKSHMPRKKTINNVHLIVTSKRNLPTVLGHAGRGQILFPTAGRGITILMMMVMMMVIVMMCTPEMVSYSTCLLTYLLGTR